MYIRYNYGHRSRERSISDEEIQLEGQSRRAQKTVADPQDQCKELQIYRAYEFVPRLRHFRGGTHCNDSQTGADSDGTTFGVEKIRNFNVQSILFTDSLLTLKGVAIVNKIILKLPRSSIFLSLRCGNRENCRDGHFSPSLNCKTTNQNENGLVKISELKQI
jgi:hypothetical protein